jgi:hypothetical protein
MNREISARINKIIQKNWFLVKKSSLRFPLHESSVRIRIYGNCESSIDTKFRILGNYLPKSNDENFDVKIQQDIEDIWMVNV